MISTYGIKTNEKHTIIKKTFTYREETKQAGGGKVAWVKGVERYSVSVIK